MKAEEVQSLFSSWIDIFYAILRQPTDADLTRLCEYLTSIFSPRLSDVENGIHNLMGLVTEKDDYKALNGTKFTNTNRTAIYDEDISNNATNVVRAKAKAVQMAKIADYQLFAAAKHKTHDFILAIIEDTWVR